MNKLNRALCEKLSIEPEQKYCVCDHSEMEHSLLFGCGGLFHGASACQCTGYRQGRVLYPDLTTQIGYFLLLAELQRAGWSVAVHSDGKHWARIWRTSSDEKRRETHGPSCHSPSMALALAAAAALGIEVQP